MRFKVSLFILFLFITKLGLAQIQGVVVNKVTNQPIPFVNIWISGENIGTSSNHAGEFSILPSDSSKFIQFSAIGFESLKIELSKLEKETLLAPTATHIKEVSIIASKRKLKKVVNELSLFNQSSTGFGCGKIPWIVSKYFPFDSSFQNTPYLNQIRLRTRSAVKNARFNIHVQAADSTGKPGKYLLSENIFGYAKKGKHKTIVDLSPYEVTFPKNGLFIGFEFLVLDENKYEFEYTMPDSSRTFQGVSYEPSIFTETSSSRQNCWKYVKGEWEHIWENYDRSTLKKNDTYSIPIIELTLSN